MPSCAPSFFVAFTNCRLGLHLNEVDGDNKHSERAEIPLFSCCQTQPNSPEERLPDGSSVNSNIDSRNTAGLGSRRYRRRSDQTCFTRYTLDRWQLQHGGPLALAQVRDQGDLPVGKLERVVMRSRLV